MFCNGILQWRFEFYWKGNIFLVSCSNVNLKVKWHLRKKTRRSQFVNDKQLYSQSIGHNLSKKKIYNSSILWSLSRRLFQKSVLMRVWKNCWINYSFTWYRKRATHTDLFSCQFFDDVLSSNFCSRAIKAQFLLLSSIYVDIEQIYFDKNETG